MKYIVKKHGLLWIVYKINTVDSTYIEDSRWDTRQKATDHCALLNKEIEKKSKRTEHDDPYDDAAMAQK